MTLSSFAPVYVDSSFTEDYQLEMMRHLRKVNVDHLSVGWYQSTQLGNFITTQLLESQFSYQTSIEESVVLIYGMFQFVVVVKACFHSTSIQRISQFVHS